MSTHRLSTVLKAQQIWFLNQEKMLGSTGDPRVLLSQKKDLYAFFEKQLS